jgi:hypothetical protein
VNREWALAMLSDEKFITNNSADYFLQRNKNPV